MQLARCEVNKEYVLGVPACAWPFVFCHHLGEERRVNRTNYYVAVVIVISFSFPGFDSSRVHVHEILDFWLGHSTNMNMDETVLRYRQGIEKHCR